MAIFGWVVLVMISVWFTVAGIFWMFLASGLTGKTSGEAWIVLAIGVALLWASYENSPFVLEVNP